MFWCLVEDGEEIVVIIFGGEICFLVKVELGLYILLDGGEISFVIFVDFEEKD